MIGEHRHRTPRLGARKFEGRLFAVAVVLLSCGVACAHTAAGTPKKPKPSALPTASVWMAPDGSDSGSNCRRFSTPVPNPDKGGTSLCATFQKAYELADLGDTVGLVSTLGPYAAAGGISDTGSFHWTSGPGYVNFVPEPAGARAVDSAAALTLSGARHVHFRNMDFDYWGIGGNSPALAQQTQDVWMDNTTVGHFDFVSVAGFRMTRGSVGGAIGCGNTVCAPGGHYRITCAYSCEPQIQTAYLAPLGNRDVTFDNVSFHDIGRAPGGGPHTSCLKVQSTIHLVIRNSRFWNCDSQTLMLTFDTTQTGSAWPLNDVNVLLENNWIDAATDWGATQKSVSPPLDLKATNRLLWNGAAVSNWTIRNNTIIGGMYWSNDDSEHIVASNVLFTGNLVQGPDCSSAVAPTTGVVWTANVSVGGVCAGAGNRRIGYWPSCANTVNGTPGLVIRKRRYVCKWPTARR